MQLLYLITKDSTGASIIVAPPVSLCLCLHFSSISLLFSSSLQNLTFHQSCFLVVNSDPTFTSKIYFLPHSFFFVFLAPLLSLFASLISFHLTLYISRPSIFHLSPSFFFSLWECFPYRLSVQSVRCKAAVLCWCSSLPICCAVCFETHPPSAHLLSSCMTLGNIPQ